MPNTNTLTGIFGDIATAIRGKNGSSDTYTPAQMAPAITAIPTGGGGGFDMSQLKTIQFLPDITEVDVTGLDTSSFTTFAGMFSSCTGLTEVDLSSFDTSNATVCTNMFRGCTGLTEIDLSSFDSLTTISCNYMFRDCTGLTRIVFPTPSGLKVNGLSGTFNGCTALTALDLGNVDTQGTTLFNGLFYNCSHLKSINFSKLDTNSATDMSTMFQGCSVLEAIIWSQKSSVQPLIVQPSTAGITSGMKFYVPDALLSNYRSSTNYSRMASQILPISDLPQTYKTLYNIS